MASKPIDFEVQGIEELKSLLKALPPKLEKQAMQRAVREGANEFRRALRAAAPKGNHPPVKSGQKYRKMGHLKRSLRVRALREAEKGPDVKGKVVYRVYTTRSAFYGRMLEYGTKKMSARPWFRPTWDANKRSVLATIRATLRRYVEMDAVALARQFGTKRRKT